MLIKIKKSPYYITRFERGGREFSRSTKCTEEREALKEEIRIIAQVERELVQAIETITSLVIEQVADRYWNSAGQYHAGADATEVDLARLVEYFGRKRDMATITHTDVQELIAWRRAHKVPHTERLISNSTINRSTIEPLKRLFNAEKRRGVHFKHEPVWKTLMLKEPVERVREIKEDESIRLARHMRADWLPIMTYALSTGARQAECLLRWEHVDFGTKQITRTGKGGKRQVIAMTPALRALLFPLQGHHDDYVFTFIAQRTIDMGAQGKRVKGKRYPITLEGLRTEWRRLCVRSKVKGLRFHDIRHDFASKLLRATRNLKLVQRMLGHANIETTMRYAHVLDEDMREGMEKLGTRSFEENPSPVTPPVTRSKKSKKRPSQ
jgi:integrase